MRRAFRLACGLVAALSLVAMASHTAAASTHKNTYLHHHSKAQHRKTHLAVYTVRPGNTLDGIAAAVHRRPAQIAAWNHLANPNMILVGQRLTIPKKTFHSHYRMPVYRAPVYHAPVYHAPVYHAPVYVPPKAPVVSATSGYQSCVIEHESGGDPTAQNPWTTASGLYGFLSSTWESVTGMPGPARAYSEATQTAAFWKLYDSAGRGPWATDGC